MPQINTSLIAPLPYMQQGSNMDTSAIPTSFMRAYELAQERNDPLRVLKMAEIDQNMRARAEQITTYMQERENSVQAMRGLSELAKVSGDISAKNAWTDPTAKKEFWATVSKFPAVATTPQFNNLLGQFEVAERAKLEHDKVAVNQQRADAYEDYLSGKLDLEALKEANRALGQDRPEVSEKRALALQRARDAHEAALESGDEQLIDRTKTFLDDLTVVQKRNEPGFAEKEALRAVRGELGTVNKSIADTRTIWGSSPTLNDRLAPLLSRKAELEQKLQGGSRTAPLPAPAVPAATNAPASQRIGRFNVRIQ